MQRVFLCRALLSDPKILILDEPDTFVDNRFEGELYEKLRLLNNHMAIVLVSHDVGTISSYVKTIACVNGELHYHPDNIITQEQLNSYNCPIKLITHGEIPHTVLKHHH
jgi:zinc transport system ATP-binding protein